MSRPAPSGSWVPAFVSVVVLLGFFGTLGACLYKFLDATMAGKIVDVLVISLVGALGTVIGYWLGSSSGSAAKNQLLAPIVPPSVTSALSSAPSAAQRETDSTSGFSRAGLLAAIALAFAASCSLTPAHAAPVTVAWDPNPAAENVTGYIVYSGPASRTSTGFTAYAKQVDVGNVTQATIDVTVPTYIAVVGYNQYGLKSDYSAELYTASGTVLLLSPPKSGAKGLCARLAATRADGSKAQVEACTDAAGKTTWTVLP